MPRRSSLSPPALCIAAAAALMGCGLDHDLRPPAPAAPSDDEATRTSAGAGALPDQLRCVSDPLDDTTDVLRLDLVRDPAGDAWTATVERGPQFWRHADGMPQAPAGALQERALVATAARTLVETTAAGTLTIDLAPVAGPAGAAVLTGTFVDDQCYLHTEARLTCWDAAALFESLWMPTPDAPLPARFDWALGACVDAAGAPARNRLPLEVIRETGLGVCVDIAGSLNGADYGYPELGGWDLSGANLDDAELFFADLTSAQLNGAQLGGLSFGYATVHGSFNEETVLPDEGDCTVHESPWAGSTVECRR